MLPGMGSGEAERMGIGDDTGECRGDDVRWVVSIGMVLEEGDTGLYGTPERRMS